MSASLHVPAIIKAKTPEELIRKLIKVQSIEGGKVGIISISQDLKSKEWVLFYYPIKYFGSQLL